MFLVKLGGSVLTDKSQYRTPRPETISRLARECAGHELILVHGAGSFGHVLAKEHRLAEGGGAPMDVARVRADVRHLQQMLLAALHDAGAPAVACATSDLARLIHGELASFDAGPVRHALAAKLMPVLGGDVVLDAAKKWGIVSGDALMARLAQQFEPELAIFVTDVDGIYDRWPGGKVVPRIGPDDMPFVTESGAAHDITGGMAGKLLRAREVAKSAPVLVINGNAPGRLADALAGKSVLGTRVES